ncbi:unnamed protein product [Leptidea sinapis]|uniref:Leucine-rich repeat-containing protein 71 n=1 Tax=Leptidea sinapis TaxID=189913 RepID=A0A5E4PWC8_9NEOP|nr:unnamed protein product [Leptidea sinapis]
MRPSKSLRSVRSSRSSISMRLAPDAPRVTVEFEKLLPTACGKLNCPYTIVVQRNQQNDDFYRNLVGKEKRLSQKRIQSAKLPTERLQSENSTSPGSETSSAIKTSDAKDIVVINSIYDNFNALVEIQIKRLKNVPRIMLKVIGLLAIYYKNLTKLSIYQSKIDGYTIYEVRKIIESSLITNICLDGSWLPEGNYPILLDSKKITTLSLCRCGINDNISKIIASKLYKSENGELLTVLNLSSNDISDTGVKYLADSLRTNRCLKYLNLADNQITDEGAISLLNILKEFPLTDEEIISKRQRHIKFLRKEALYLQYMNESDNTSSKSAKKKLLGPAAFSVKVQNTKKGQLQDIKQIGVFHDPFQRENIVVRDGISYCTGNTSLCYINMAYNNVSFMTLKKLKSVLEYQNAKIKNVLETGLLKIVLEGNNLPLKCAEMSEISELLRKNLNRFSQKHVERKRSERVTLTL